MTGQPGLVMRLALAPFAVACLSSTGALAVPPAVTGEATAARMESTPNDQSAIPGPHAADEADALPLVMGRPGSVAARLRLDAEPKEYLFQFPGVSEALKPWYDWKADLDKNHGIRFAISYTAFYQKANHVFGTEDDAAGFDLDISGTWTFLGRGTDSPTKLGFGFFRRDTLGTDSPLKILSDRELQVFGLIGRGRRTRRVAEILHLSVKTIESHREHFKRNLHLESGAELAQRATQWVETDHTD